MKTNIQANFNENLINKKENLFQYEKIEKIMITLKIKLIKHKLIQTS